MLRLTTNMDIKRKYFLEYYAFKKKAHQAGSTPCLMRLFLHIHAVLQRQGCEGMLEIVEADVFRTDVLEDLLMGVPEGVRIEYPARLG